MFHWLNFDPSAAFDLMKLKSSQSSPLLSHFVVYDQLDDCELRTGRKQESMNGMDDNQQPESATALF